MAPTNTINASNTKNVPATIHTIDGSSFLNVDPPDANNATPYIKLSELNIISPVLTLSRQQHFSKAHIFNFVVPFKSKVIFSNEIIILT